MALSVSLNELTYTIPEENETGYGVSLTTYLSDLADYLQFGYLSNVGQRLKLNTVSTSGTINNLNTNNISIVRLTNANIVSGIGNVVEGKFVTLINASANTIELTHQDPLSDTNNRFIIPGEKSFYLKPNETITLYYDSSETRWRLIDSSRFINENLSVNSTSGVITTLDTTNKTFIKLTNATEVKGINLPESGRKLYILNATLERILLKQESLDSTANERIITEFGYDYVLDPEAVVELIYDGNANRWRTINTDSIKRDKIDVITTSGAIHNLDISKISVIKFTQATEITGFNSNEEGRELIIFNDNSSPLTIKNESLDSTASNRIQTDTDSDVTLRQYGTAILKYDSSSNRWRIQSRTIDNSEYDDTYQLRSEKGVALGYASLDASGTVPVNQIDLSFFDLNDVTSTTFTGNKTKVVRVNNDETGLELGFANNSTNNYIQFPTAIYSDPLTLGWELYNDGGSVPVDGQGGTPGIDLVSEVLTSQSGFGYVENYEDYSGVVSDLTDWYHIKNLYLGDGNGISYPFTLNAQHRSSILELSFDYYNLNQGVANNINISAFLLDEDTNTLIYADKLKVLDDSQPATLPGQRIFPRKYVGTFQTSPSSTNYRLCFHIVEGGNNFSDFFFKNVKLWNQEKNYGSIITEWQSYTPTFSNMGSSPSSALFWRRNGQSLEIKGRITAGSSVPTAVSSFSTPNGYVIDSSVCATRQAVGLAIRAVGSANQCNLLALGGESIFTFSIGDGGSNALTPANGSSTFSNSEIMSINLSVPIQGWGGTVQLSSQVGDGRLVACRYYSQPSQTIDTTVPLQFATKDYDTHNAVTIGTVSTSNAWRFTAPQSGYYSIKAGLYGQSGGVNYRLRKNGSIYTIFGHTTAGNFGTGVGQVYLLTGEYIDITGTTSFSIDTSALTFISIEQIAGGSQAFAREESVACSYYSSANQTSLTTQINFGVKIYDTHNAVTTGSSWKFTAPQNGKYLLTGFLQSNGNYRVILYKNNSVHVYGIVVIPPTSNYDSFSHTIDLLAGDYIDLRPDSSSTWYGNATLSGGYACQIQITKVS